MDAADNIVDNLPADLADSDEEGAGFAGDGRESDDESSGSDGTHWILDEEWALPQIKDNDPNLTAISFHEEVSQDVDWEKNARFIGENTRLTHVSIDNYDSIVASRTGGGEKADNFAAFCKGVGANGFIESLIIAQCSIRGCETSDAGLRSLAPLFESGKLHTFKVKESRLPHNSPLVSSLLQNCHSLENVKIDCDGQSFIPEFIEALEGKESIKKIDLGVGVDPNDNVYLARGRPWDCTYRLGNLLQSPKCAVAEIALQIDGMDKTCITFLAASLAQNKSVVILNLSCNTSLDQNAWGSFATSLQKHSFFSLEELDLSGNDLGGDVLAVLESALSSSTKLKSLRLRDNDIVGAWGAFLSTWCTASALSELDISGNPIGDAAVLDLANGLVINTALRRLYLRGTGIDDDGAIALKNGLMTNVTLEDLDLSSNAGIGNRSLKAFCELLCNPSSIDDTYASNHTLQSLGSLGGDDPDLKARLALLRYKNSRLTLFRLKKRSYSKGKVVRWKIITTHFVRRSRSCSNVSVGAFLDMELNVLPRAMAWVGRESDRDGLSIMHKLLLALPSLLYRPADGSNKRKRGV